MQITRKQYKKIQQQWEVTFQKQRLVGGKMVIHKQNSGEFTVAGDTIDWTIGVNSFSYLISGINVHFVAHEFAHSFDAVCSARFV